MNNKVGYREIEHTADRQLLVWGPGLTALLETAAKGMYALSLTELSTNQRIVRNFIIPFEDRESLLVDFLSELLFYGEDEGIAFDDYEFSLTKSALKVQATGAPIENQAKEIKAVTYHDMKILEMESGLEVYIVFDV